VSGSATKQGGDATTTPPDEAVPTPAEELSRDECFELLSNHRRRYTLHYLEHNGEEATLGELADQIAAWENEIPPESVSYDQRKRVYTSLQQVHLPRMDDTGVVEFDDREGLVEPGPAAEDLDIYLEVVQSDDVPWSLFYLVLALLNLALVVAATAGAPLLGLVPPQGWAVFVLTTFLVTSGSHLYLTRTKMRLGGSEQPPDVEEG
jgi:hypothetical protein